MTERRTVELLEGNETIRRIMATSLREVGLEVLDGGEGTPERLADLLVADVDSGVPGISERAAAYLDDDRLVLFCGLRESRDRFQGERWVQRPFTPAAFVAECADALGGGLHTSSAADADDPDFDADATAALQPPPDARLERRDEPITRELGYDEAQQLEERLGLAPGALVPVVEPTVNDLESFEVLDLDDSAILDVSQLHAALGGKLVSPVLSRRVATQELVALREAELPPRGGERSRTFNQTMPDSPHAFGGPEAETDETDSLDARSRRTTSEVGGIPTRPMDSSLEALVPPSGVELAMQIRGVARMLADSWHRIGLTSRTEDRAERIERILRAAVTKGSRAALEEVQRVPLAAGFAGSLAALTFVEVARTIRDRRLRGRLEVAIGDDAFVVHVDGLYLDEIDTLSGNVEGMLLEILHQGGALDERTYQELIAMWRGGQFDGPLELELARRKVVADATLQSARVVRAREIFRRLCASRGGQFAFLEIRPGDGQPWPVDPLRINVDQLMLELLRESSIDTGDSQATASTHLQLDPNRAAALDPGRLTEEERSVLNFFRGGDTLESARARLQKQAGPEDVDRIVDRLKKVELLKRSDPSIQVPPRVETAARQPPASLRAEEPPRTVVSSASDIISQDEKFAAKTASMTPNWDLIPDTSELDDLIAEGIAAFESEMSEAHAEVDDDTQDGEPS